MKCIKPMRKEKENIFESFNKVLSHRESLPYDEYLKWALYDPKIGYYTSQRLRIGRTPSTDFYTSTSLGKLWGKLIIEASQKLLSGKDPKNYSFIEIAAEPMESSIGNLDHPFKDARTIRLGEKTDIPELAIVFSNEWLDAQPFKRFRFDKNSRRWREMGVKVLNKKWVEVEIPIDQSDTNTPKKFPCEYNFSYVIDWPTGAELALTELLQRKWNGLFLTFDYGLDSERIFRDFPEGTARAYSNHKQTNNILNQPGTQDITCHICWNSLVRILNENGFPKPTLQSQESFFMNYAQNEIKRCIKSNYRATDGLNTLKNIIHPVHLGHKFQGLHATRKI
ncbi:MAG: SAM-dependent methyltransferase [Verrucomicrobiota bacterium]|nr:SAM-dependent methyltransferase [Verrucomicrobiota bacterium]